MGTNEKKKALKAKTNNQTKQAVGVRREKMDKTKPLKQKLLHCWFCFALSVLTNLN